MHVSTQTVSDWLREQDVTMTSDRRTMACPTLTTTGYHSTLCPHTSMMFLLIKTSLLDDFKCQLDTLILIDHTVRSNGTQHLVHEPRPAHDVLLSGLHHVRPKHQKDNTGTDLAHLLNCNSKLFIYYHTFFN